MSDILRDLLGIDPDTTEWTDFALCRGMDTNLLYDDYETDTQVAKTVDAMCSSCPVRKQCLSEGVERGEWGVWGGIYLTSGKPDKNRNSHKTQEQWNEIRELLSDTLQ